jgi:hypothetical protein
VRVPEPQVSRRWRRRRLSLRLTEAASDLLGTPVQVAIPLQRHHPAVVLGMSVAEVAALVGAILTGGGAALVALVLLAIAVVTMAATNRHRVLALTSSGLLVLSATARGRPHGVVGPAPATLTLPVPSGLGAAVKLADRTWWVERAAFPRLERARQLLGPTAGE